MHVTAIIAAGGRGERFGGARPKQLLEVCGRPILERSVDAFLRHPSVDAVVVALPPSLVDDPPGYLRPRSEGAGKPLRIVAGGERRQDSVANAFRAIDAASDIVVVHDAARPFVSSDLIARTIAAAAESGAAVAALAARDTVKRSGAGTGAGRMVGETLPRETIFLAQTPQAFRRGVLERALASAAGDSADATDEATLVERGGHAVRIVEGEASNIKITVAGDLPVAEAIARGAAGAGPVRTGRAGTGYDLHRLVAGRPLVLGGVTIPSERGALGHSDADVVCHAVTDAILGGACLGDIGRHFPDSDPAWKDASSLDLLKRAVALADGQGYEVGNVDVTVILETPKIRGYVDAMRTEVAGAIGIDVSRVSIKGKTNEGVDAIGRGEAIAAHAIALVRARGDKR
jgi:2-C-methyl-D-erythritol 4-phosphate cytidylyltransferase / 2-C-methyl-D-erythritol 2,4-cyclodiphosphate synthase